MIQKVIFEVGLLFNGLSVIRRQYLESTDLSISPILVGELLSIIQDFSTSTHGNIIPQVLQMEDFTTCLFKFTVDNEPKNYLLYVICQASTYNIRSTLEKLAKELKTYESILLNWNIDSESIENLYPIFDEFFLPFNK
jgi:hypothetical protein